MKISVFFFFFFFFFFFLSGHFHFLVVKVSVYLNRRVFVMTNQNRLFKCHPLLIENLKLLHLCISYSLIIIASVGEKSCLPRHLLFPYRTNHT